MRTIIVDDERWMLEQFEDECRGIPDIQIVGKFRNPLQALAYVEENTVDLAFLDIEMPEMSGLELSNKLRDLCPKMIVIFVSAYDGYMSDAFRKHNADYFLVKPYSHRDLTDAVERAALLSGRLRKKIFIRTFGAFDLLLNNQPLPFPDEKAKELLAILVDERGKLVATSDVVARLYPGDTVEYSGYRKALRELQELLKQYKIADLLQISGDQMKIQIENVDCDLMMFEDGNSKTMQRFNGVYMESYPWAKRTREQLKKKLSLYDRYQEESIRNALCAMIRCRLDDAWTLEYVNDSFLAITGYTREDLEVRYQKSLKKIIVPEDLEIAVPIMEKQLANSEFKEIEYRIRCKNGDTLWVLDKGRVSVFERDGEMVWEFECMLIDISAYKSKLTELEQHVEQDALTKLYTRGTAQKLIEQYLLEKPQDEVCAMILLDIDDFKRINDTYGHPFADTVLTDVAAILKRSFRSNDIIGRLGGDEMIAFLPNIPDTAFLRGRIAAFFGALHKRMLVKTSAGEITCSLGAAVGPDDGINFAELYRQADIALYWSKQHGKGCATLRQDVTDAVVKEPIDQHDREEHHDSSFVEYMQQQLTLEAPLPDTIDALLSIIGQQTEASRVYIFENGEGNRYMVNTFEWCAQDCSPEIDNLQMLPYESLNVYMQMLRSNNGMFNIYDINMLDADVYEILEPQGIQSMLHTELLDEHGVCYGVLGVDECRKRKYWSGVQCMTLKICGAEIGKALSAYRKQARTVEELQAFVQHRKQTKGLQM